MHIDIESTKTLLPTSPHVIGLRRPTNGPLKGRALRDPLAPQGSPLLRQDSAIDRRATSKEQLSPGRAGFAQRRPNSTGEIGRMHRGPLSGSAALLGLQRSEPLQAAEAKAARRTEILEHFKSTKQREVLNQVVRELMSKKLSQKEMFERLDVSGDGNLSRAEMQYGLRRLGITLTLPELDAFLKAFDRDGNGAIDFEEFSQLITSHASTCAEELEENMKICGFQVGGKVTSLFHLGALEVGDDGVVIGPGNRLNTVMVRFARCQQTLSVKPTQIKEVRASKG